jgi:site-specific DNA recombinase
MEACEVHGGFVASVTEPINTTEPYGQFVAEFLVAQARMESANQSTRLRRKARELRERGVPPSNGRRCFGYATGYAVAIPEEAALLREARDRVLAGESLRGICFDWADRGVRSSRGNQWGVTVLRRLLCSATLSGQREYEGQLFPGTWPAIFSPEDTLQLRTYLAAKHHSRAVRPARNALLTSYIRCGRCGQRMYANRRTDRQRRYVCVKVAGTPGCGQMSTLAEPLEEFVAELIFAAVDDSALRNALRARSDDDDGLLQSVQRDEATLEQLANDHYVENILSRQEFLSARGALTKRLEVNREKLSRRDRRGVLGQFVGSGETLRAAWADGAFDWRRAIVAALLDRVEVMPATEKGRKPFDPNRVKPVWRY